MEVSIPSFTAQSCRSPHHLTPRRSFPEADIGNGTQHFGGAEGRYAGQNGPVQAPLLLTQHSFALAARPLLQNGRSRESGH